MWFELVAPKLPFGKPSEAPAAQSVRRHPPPDSPGPVTALSAAAPVMGEGQEAPVPADAKLQNMVAHVLRVATEVTIVPNDVNTRPPVARLILTPVGTRLPSLATPTIPARFQDKDANLRCAALKLLGTRPVFSALGLVPDALFDSVFR